MKKILLTTSLVLSVVLVKAQINKGIQMIGGQTSFFESSNMSAPSGIKTLGEMNTLYYGKSYKTNKAWGIGLFTGRIRNQYYANGTSVIRDRNASFGISVFQRTYFTLGRKWYFILQPELALSTAQTKTFLNSGTTTITQKQKAAELSIAPGFAFKLTDRFHLEAFIPSALSMRLSFSKNYNTLTGAYVNNENLLLATSSFAGGIDTDLVGLGVRYYFSGKKKN